ncbi:MAG: hypothetical protein HKP54_15495, partial [Boseongicola sp.]|nr:hypothetical protein [Boseongicola sp.]
MIGRLDFLVAFGLAAGVHVAGFGYFAATDGFEGAGTEGRAALSLQAASPGIAELVAEWDTTPNVAELRETIDAPDAQTAFTKVNAWTDTRVVRSVTKLSDAPDVAAPPDVAKAPSPTLAAVTTQSPSAPRVAQGIKVARMTTPVMPRAAVPASMPEPLAEVERAVLATPRPPVRPKRREAAPAIVARGTGGGVSAGNLGATQAVATIAPAARKAAQAAWAQSIQKRIARHQSYP